MGHRDAILLIDDDETARDAARRMLEYLGYRVIAAANGPEALETAQANPSQIRCVVVDLTMPGMDGCACVCALRAMRANLPVVLTSGCSEHELARSEINGPATAVLQKPYRRVELARALERLIG